MRYIKLKSPCLLFHGTFAAMPILYASLRDYAGFLQSGISGQSIKSYYMYFE